jgi:hypothetical protein
MYILVPILSLFVHGRIPIRIIEYNNISSCQVDTYPTATSRRDETENLRVLVELLN